MKKRGTGGPGRSRRLAFRAACVLAGALLILLGGVSGASGHRAPARVKIPRITFVGPPSGVAPFEGVVDEREAQARRQRAARAFAEVTCPQEKPNPACNMTWHNGPVMHEIETVMVNWEPEGYTVSPNYHYLAGRFLRDVAADSGRATNPFATDTQYTDEIGAVRYESTYAGGITLTDPFPPRVEECPAPAPATTCLTSAQEVNELNSYIARQHLSRGPSRLYFLVLPQNVNTCFNNFKSCGPYSSGTENKGYCAYHSWFGTEAGLTLWANQPYASDGQCPGNWKEEKVRPNNDPADQLIDEMSHEMNETMTDPTGKGWYDVNGEGENGDKCNFQYGALGTTSTGENYDVLINHDPYQIQKEWSNASSGCAMTFGALTPFASWSANPASGIEDQPMTFDASASHANNWRGYLTKYTWNFGDETLPVTTTEPKVSHTFYGIGNYTVKLTVTDDAGLTSSSTQTLRVNVNSDSAWGYNGGGALGNGTFTSTDAPVTIEHLIERAQLNIPYVAELAAGSDHSLAVLSYGEVKAWGDNRFGQLGIGSSPEFTAVPKLVPGISEAVAVAGGFEHSLALMRNGTVKAWGANPEGQLGTGNETSSSVPVSVPGLSGVVAIAAGMQSSYALLKDGTVMSWGDNEEGALGDGSFGGQTCSGSIPCSRSPVPVTGLSHVVAISAGGRHALALLANGQVEAWGSNGHGELGNGEETTTDAPVFVEELHSPFPPIVRLSGIVAVAAGESHSLALQENGEVRAWGNDEHGQLGDGEKGAGLRYPFAELVHNLGSISGIAAGCEHSLATAENLNSGTVFSWGAGGYGQLGNGETKDSTVPVQVSSADDRGIAAGCTHSLDYRAPLPSVRELSPASGPPEGGNAVTISGTGLAAASFVRFGSVPATGWEITSPTSIVATAPAGTGTVNVTVTGPGGRSFITQPYRYVKAPSVSGISPAAGPEAGGTSVTISGTHLTGAGEVRFGLAAATSFTVNSDTSITAVAPAGSGTVNVTVITPEGASASSALTRFSYLPAPVVASLKPPVGPEAGGTTVTVTGSGFTGVSAVQFGAAAASSYSVSSESSLTAVAPAGAGTAEVTVTATGGTSAASEAAVFTYLPPPAVTEVSPSAGPLAGANPVTITGTNLAYASEVTFGGVAGSGVTVNSPTSITVNAPAHEAANVDIVVTTPGGTSPAVAGDRYTYEHAPGVTSIAPKGGPVGGGTKVKITGTNLATATAVRFGGAEASSFKVVSATSIVAVAPASAAPGTVDVTVVSPGGTSALVTADRYKFLPTVTGVSPPGGPIAGGTHVTITGTGFAPGATGTQIKFGTAKATGVSCLSSTECTAVSPPHAAGTVDVTATVNKVTSAKTTSDRFAYS